MKRVLVCLLAVTVALACDKRSSPAPQPTPPQRAGADLSVLLITIDTLRADHLGVYGYARKTSPNIDQLAASGTVFDQACTFWPKTRGSFVMMFTGKRPSQNGYSKSHPVILDFNPTLASALKQAGYRTEASVDNPNVAAAHGYAKGFDRYRETWEEKALASEADRARAISDDGIGFLSRVSASDRFFVWLHYVSPHAPYSPPAPYDTLFAGELGGKPLPIVESLHGGIPKQWAVAGKQRLADYVALYDGEIAAVDAEVGRVLRALATSSAGARTLVVLTSDHGESLGEHDYYFDHGENLFDPSMRIPLIVAMPGAPPGKRSAVLATTLDLFPTILDAVKLSFPPDLAGSSLLPALRGASMAPRDRLFGQNERGLSATWDRRFKVVARPSERAASYALYDRESDPGETKDASRGNPGALRNGRRELELFVERSDREWGKTRGLVGETPPGEGRTSRDACEKLKALGYVGQCAP